jgi:hypothetical protein
MGGDGREHRILKLSNRLELLSIRNRIPHQLALILLMIRIFIRGKEIVFIQRQRQQQKQGQSLPSHSMT